MQRWSKHTIFRVCALAVCLMGLAREVYAQKLTWLGAPMGDFSDSEAYAISDDGRYIVGSSSQAVARWDSTGRRELLGTLGGVGGGAFACSSNGEVLVGAANNASGVPRAFRWQNGVMQELGGLPPTLVSSYAEDVSADGSVVVGYAYLDNLQQAVRWANGTATLLGTLGGSLSVARIVSADGRVIIGHSQNPNRQQRMFRWENGVMQEISGIPEFIHYYPSGANSDCSVIVGQMVRRDDAFRAFRWRSGSYQVLGMLAGYSSAAALGVTSNGSIAVGEMMNSQGSFAAVLWDAQGRAYNLNTLYANLLQENDYLYVATDITPDGRYIVGFGYNSALNRTDGFLLDTVPEPTTLLILSAGLAGIAAARRRRLQ
ncbi:MAG: PEP-CTERM sorting domain-containing protein [Fimbriimonadales bacterium]|nr:PEP-CTERM sorting domain-containing protein [Fimbriimonadales bacterium]